MRIQHNTTAANTHRMYSINNNAVAKSAERLSSGYRINRAGDDAAGLAISEKMRAQVRGLNMASKNSQDAVSLIQTAEGALQEVHSMLQRMNELANQAATGTNETFDRDQINAEFNQLKNEIDQIADTTTFNNMKLLDGTLASDAAKVSVNAVSTLKNGASLTGSAPGGAATYTVTQHAGLSAQVGEYDISDLGNGKINIKFTDAATKNVTNTEIDLNEAVTGEVANGKSFTVDLSPAGLGTYTMTAGNVSGKAAGIADLASALATGDVNTGVGAATIAANPGGDGTTNVRGAITFDFDTGAIMSALGDEGGEYAISLSVNSSNKVELIATGADGTQKVLSTSTETVDDVTTTVAQTFTFTDIGSVDVAAQTFATGTGATIAQLGEAFASADLGTLGASGGSEGGLKIQVGANEGEQLKISVASMNTKGLGISNNSISDQTKAGSAITATQKAINLVSEQRATMGAMQNRLEHKIANLDNTSENLSAAESRIRDVDIAMEMTTFTKNNILSQAATAMLAQANAAPQGVLSLLQ